MSEFDFNNVNVETNVNNYLKPGNYLVKGTEVKSGESAQKKSPYVEITVQDNEGKTCNQQYYLNTEVGEGKTKSAMDISAQAIVQIVAAANGIDIFDKNEATATANKDKAKALIGKIASKEALATKLATLLVGKEFAIHLNGKWVNPTDTAKQSWIKAEFGGGRFAVIKSQLDTLPKEPKIKGENVNATTTATTKSGW